MDRMSIGPFIAALRKARGLTQKELAAMLSVSDKTVSRWETGDGTPELALIPVLAEIFGVTCDELLRGERRPQDRDAGPSAPKGEKRREWLLKSAMTKLNIKAVTFTQDVSAFTSYSFKPQLKTLGPKYGKRLGEIRTALMELDGSAAKKELDANGVLRLELQGGAVELAPEDLLIEMTQSDRYFTVEDGGVTVAIDTELTEALIEEGFVRELVSKFQTMRKEAGFHVEDHIRAYASGNRKIEALLAANSAQVGGDILADAVCTGSLAGYTKEWDVNGEAVTLGVERI